MKVAFYRHNIGETEIAAVAAVLRSPIHTAGPVTQEFEKAFARHLGCTHAVGVTSWTMGAFLCLKALEIGPDDEVIVPPLTFISTANIVCHAGATPVFADVERDTGLLSVEAARRAITPRTRAIIPVHMYGAMCDMRAFERLARERGVALIEDAAHCVEGERDGVRPGQLSRAACFSFYATKNLACGDGGAVATNDTALAAKVSMLRFHGMTRGSEERYSGLYRHYDMEEIGYKCNLTDIQSALLLSQLPRLEEYRARKDHLARLYEKGLGGVPGVELMKSPAGGRHARHLFTFLAPEGQRDRWLAGLQRREIGIAVHFNPVHLMTWYRRTFGFKEGAFPHAERIGLRTITLPLYPKLSDDEATHVVRMVSEVASKAG
ncbi:MAG: DegT/DnrJ/EryC1/StrS aminotransferase family protein [Verrucomicrobiae bacterium]|nr:DegT/DnrJ/EryC1/StrS aminotransferase family protein [Verrucomicrobiae bacterium]